MAPAPQAGSPSDAGVSTADRLALERAIVRLGRGGIDHKAASFYVQRLLAAGVSTEPALSALSRSELATLGFQGPHIRRIIAQPPPTEPAQALPKRRRPPIA